MNKMIQALAEIYNCKVENCTIKGTK